MYRFKGIVVGLSTLTLSIVLARPAEAQQRPRSTELLLDSVPADSARCGGLTFQFARYFRDQEQTRLVGENRAGSTKMAIDAWIWNRGDSVATYDPHMFTAVNKDGIQISFWNADEVATYVAGHRNLLQSTDREARERDRSQVSARREYAGGRILPGVSAGRRILVPDNDRDFDEGISLFCGERPLGRLHRQGH